MPNNPNMINTFAEEQFLPPCTRQRDPPNYVWLSKIVFIEVGTGNTRNFFHAHHGLLTFYSADFKGALAGDWAESPSARLILDSEDPAVFEDFVVWLYSSRISVDRVSQVGVDRTFESLVKLWIFAYRRCIPLLMNEVIYTLREFIVVTEKLPSRTLGLVFSSATLEDCPLRRFIIFAYAKLTAQDARHAFNADLYACSPRVLPLGSAMAMFDDPQPCRSQEEFRRFKICSFHVHVNGARCEG